MMRSIATTGIVACVLSIIGCGANPFAEKPPARPPGGGGQSALAAEQPVAPPAASSADASQPAELPGPDSPEWRALGFAHRIEGIEVRIVEARLEPTPAAPGEESEAPTHALILRVRIDNKAVTREVPFRGWYKQTSPPLVRLVDNRKKNYRMIPFEGAIMAGSPKLKAEGTTMHELVFEPPDGLAQTLYLELPGQRLGLSEPFHFAIPVAQIRRPAASPGAAPGGEPSDKNKNEDAAARKLKFAKQFLDQNKPQDAREYLEDILKRWPDTDAAKEAKKLLDRLKK